MSRGSNTGRADIILLLGFDRCGLSMVSRVLSNHPQVTSLFHPFNSTEVTERQWEIWDPSEEVPETETFLLGLLNGQVLHDYIRSDWFRNYSSSTQVDLDGINFVKDTKLHFKTEWLRKKFPEITIHALWRDPRAIVCSLMRNDFYTEWYGDKAYREIVKVIESNDWAAKYSSFLGEHLSDTQKMAIILAVRTDYLFQHLDHGDWLNYEEIIIAPNLVLNSYLARWDLDPFDFSRYMHQNHNVVGKPFQKPDLWKEYFDSDDIEFLNTLFSKIGP